MEYFVKIRARSKGNRRLLRHLKHLSSRDRDIQILSPSEVEAKEDKDLTRLLESSLEDENVSEKAIRAAIQKRRAELTAKKSRK